MAAVFPAIRRCQPPLDEPCKEACGASEVIEGQSARNRALASCSKVQSGQEVGGCAAFFAIRDLTVSRIVGISHGELKWGNGRLTEGQSRSVGENHARRCKGSP